MIVGENLQSTGRAMEVSMRLNPRCIVSGVEDLYYGNEYQAVVP